MRLAVPGWLLFGIALSACSNDDAAPTAPPPKVTLRVSSLLPVGEAAWYEPAPEDWVQPIVALGCDRSLGIGLTIENFSLRSPDACGGAVQCGYAQVSLLRPDDESVVVGPVESASTVPLLDLSALEPVAGDYLVRPALLTTLGLPYVRNYLELPADLPLTLTDGCDPSAGGAGGEGSGAPEAVGGESGSTPDASPGGGGATGE